MEPDNRSRLKQWLESGEARLQPLTFPQRELWETSPVPVARVIERQEAMRISFLPGKDRPLQMVRSTGTSLLKYRELSAAEIRPEAFEELMKETYRVPFDLMQGPLHRVDMLRRGTNDHVLAFSIHHAIADGWSLGVFVQDLCTAYVMGLKGIRKAVAVGLMGMQNTLPPVPQTYTEWAAAERVYWQPGELSRRAEFWKSQLKGSSRVWNDPRGTGPDAGPLRRLASAVPADLTRGVRELVVKSSATLYSTLLSAFQLTLSKWTKKNDILVGTPVANRNKEATRQTMGYFAGVVPLRGQIDPAQTFSRHLRAVHESAVDSFANAMPFAELASALGESRTTGEHSVFDVRFALQNHPVPDVVLPRISTKLRMRSTGTPRFDLGCEITEIGSELEVVWLFQPAMFAESDIGELNALFLKMVANVCRSPDNRIDALTV
ncbi:MAG: condensation domain protein [Verrucomicrobia bacterium]|nr:condensation domain protein [Verrucomicrobiota bacterium]